MKRITRLKLAGIYSKISDSRRCLYCGVSADSLDHFIPLSFAVAISEFIDIPRKMKKLIPACRECNSIAGSKIFPTVGAKRRYIQAHLKAKYGRFLVAPRWTEHELSELGYNLRTFIEKGMTIQEIMQARIHYKHYHIRVKSEKPITSIPWRKSYWDKHQQPKGGMPSRVFYEKLQEIPIIPKHRDPNYGAGQKFCSNCQESFITHNPTKRFCTTTCREEYYERKNHAG